MNLNFPCRPHCIHIQIYCVGSYKALKMSNNMVLLDISHWLYPVIEHKWNVWCVTLSTIYFYTVTEFVKITFGLVHNINTNQHLLHAHITLCVCMCLQWKHPLQYFQMCRRVLPYFDTIKAQIASRRTSKWAIFMGHCFFPSLSLSLAFAHFRQTQSSRRLLYGFDFKWSVSK